MFLERFKIGLAFSLWCGGGTFIASFLFALLLGKDLKKLYFTETYLFYDILILVFLIFILGFFWGSSEKEHNDE